jgi:hypothetical protein
VHARKQGAQALPHNDCSDLWRSRRKNFRDPTCRRGLVLRYNRAQCLMLDPNPVSRSATLHLFPIQSAEPG